MLMVLGCNFVKLYKLEDKLVKINISDESFPIDWGSSPKEVIGLISSYSEIIKIFNGKTFMVWRCWNGPRNQIPLILFHGGWGSWTHWLRVIPYLSKKRTIFAVDFPGMGSSSDFHQSDDGGSMSKLISKAIEKLMPGDQQYDLAGFSFGAVIGAKVAAIHGNKCRNFLIVGAAGFGKLHNIVDGIVIPSVDLNTREIDTIHKNNLRLLMLANEDSIDALAIYIHRQNIECGRFKSRRISKGESFINLIPKIKAKIGGIWGELDSTCRGLQAIIERKKIIQRHQPDCQFDLIEGCGHWVMYEKPREFVASLFKQLN